MGMQIKLTFYTYYKNNNSYILADTKHFNIDDTANENLGDNVAIFQEYNKISVRFESDDNKSVLEIDNSIYENPLILKPGDDIVTISEAEDHDNMLTPGYYGISILTSKKRYKGLYFIKSKSISWDGIINLRRYLETIMSELSQNLYIQRMVGQKNIYGDENYSLNKMYTYINNNIDNVINSIDSIIKNPLTDIQKKYREQYYSKRLDLKGQRWLYTKGISKNNNVYMPEIVLEKHSFLNSDIIENCYIKKIIQVILDKILFIESYYKLIYSNTQNKVTQKEFLYKKETNEYNISKDDRVVGTEYKKQKYSEISFLKNDILKLQDRLKFTEIVLENLQKIKSILLYYINETWLEQISALKQLEKVSQKLLRDNRYYIVYDFYLNILDLEKNDAKNRKPYFPSKKTSKLFEYYSVSMLVNILREDDFLWDSGWLADGLDDELFNGEIPTNVPLIFIKDNLRVELIYEKEVETNITVIKNNTSDFVRMNGRHYKPDVILSLFDNDTNRLLTSIVIEVKCCMSKNLQSKNGPSKVIEQVRDYYNFGYYDINKSGRNKTLRGIIDKIIIIYPKQNNIIEYEYDDINISFIQVEANESKDISTHYGYTELKKEIDSYFC